MVWRRAASEPVYNAPQMLLTEGTQIGKYEILGALGAGAMGEVFRARDRQLGREIALKVLPEGFASDATRLHRFEREARSASALNHPNIITIHEIGEASGVPYIAMELVEGKTLRELLRPGALPFKRALQLAVQLGDGLAKAHAAGIVHRDLKPENVMVTPGGLAKILDFGLAKLAELDKEETLVAGAATIAVTHKGLILGTVGYMSPEQASGRTADFASDQFSLGTILYEMVTGNRAFARETAVETLTAIIRDEPAPIAEINRNVPAPFRWIVDRCLAKEPADRYADTTDLARELRTLQDHLSDASVLNLSARVRRPKHLGRIAAAVTVTALLTVAGFLMGWQANAPQPIKVSQLTFRRGHAQHGRFAPNGSIVYNANWAGQPVGLFTTNTEAPESRSLGNANSGLFAVSRNGELAIAQNCVMNWGVCGGTLARVPLSGGTPKAVEEGVDSADWRPDGESFVMARAVHGKYQIQEYPSGKMLYESAGWIADLRVSPRGDWIAFAEHPALRYSYGSVVVIDSAGRNKQVLSGTWRSIMGLAWHPDGNRIWFSASIKGDGPGSGQESWIHEVTLSGKERDVYRAPSTLYVEDISADGRQVLVLRQSPRAVLMTAASDAGLERDVAWFNSSTLADLSSDGKTLLFDEELVTGAAGLVVYVRDSDASDAVRVGEGRALALSPDKRWALAIQQMTPLRLALLPVGPGQPRAMDTGAMAEVYWATWFP